MEREMIYDLDTCLQAIKMFNEGNWICMYGILTYDGGYAKDIVVNNDNDTVEAYFQWLADNGFKFKLEEGFWPQIEEEQLYKDNVEEILVLTAEFELAYHTANWDHLNYLLEQAIFG